MVIARYVFVLIASILFADAASAAEDAAPNGNAPNLKLKMTMSLAMGNIAEPTAPDTSAATLTGDWGGTRTALDNKGINLAFTHKSDFMSDAAGGIKRGTVWMGHTEARISMDMEKLLGWDSTSAYILYLSDLGSKFNRDYVGAFVGVDNIETTVNTAQFFDAWMQKNFYGDSLSVLAGLYPIDSEFYVTDTSGLFIQPPYGMANELAQSGQNGPPIFPVGALAVRVKFTSPGKNVYAQFALTDGVPGDPDNPYGTHIQLNNGDGTLSIMEFGLTPQDNAPAPAADAGKVGAKPQEEAEFFNKTAIGFWRYTTQLDDLVALDASGNPVHRPDQGIYFLSERTLMTEKNHPSHGLSGFVRFGTASDDIHQADWTGSVGLRYHGLIEGRDDDIAGIAVTYNHASDKFRLIYPGAASNQTQLEATYRAQINPWFALQPTVQFIANPNMKLDADGDPTLENVWIVGARAEINF